MSAGDLERTEAASALRSQTASYTEINNTLCVLQHLILKCIVNVQFRADVQCITSTIVIFHRDIWRTFFFSFHLHFAVQVLLHNYRQFTNQQQT